MSGVALLLLDLLLLDLLLLDEDLAEANQLNTVGGSRAPRRILKVVFPAYFRESGILVLRPISNCR
jgi:hypothetical protein